MKSSAPTSTGGPDVVPHLIAQHILNTAGHNGKISAEHLGGAISEVTTETQIIGAALLQLTLIDPDWKITRSGICSRNSAGFLQPIDVNYPEGTSVWWRVAMVDIGSDQTQPNLTLTFQHRPIAWLMRCGNHAIGWPSHNIGSTRAQFFQMLLKRMPSELPPGLVGPLNGNGDDPASVAKQFVCPDLNVVQPVAGSGIYGQEVVTGADAAAKNAGINKLPGLTAASSVTVHGQKPTSVQLQNINSILSVGQQLGAPTNALIAAIYASMGESNIGVTSTRIFETTGDPSAYSNGTDVTAAANGFFTGGPSFAFSAIALAKAGHSPAQIANAVENNYVYEHSSGADGGSSPNGTGDSYAHQWAGLAKTGIQEATDIVNANGSGLLTDGVTTSPTSDIAELTRGTPDNPGEDSWTCMQRLASEVNWMIWSDPQPHPGVWGNYIYYMDGTTCVAQKPSLYLELSDHGDYWRAQDPTTGKFLDGTGDGMVTNLTSTTDNSAVQSELIAQSGAAEGKTGSTRVAKNTSIQQPQTPTQVMFDLIVGRTSVLHFNAGQTVVIRNTGAIDGRWILEDATHNTLGDEFVQVTLGPPEFAYPEPQADSVTVTDASGLPVTVSTKASSTTSAASTVSHIGDVRPTTPSKIIQGSLMGVVQAAKLALADQQKYHYYQYFEQDAPARETGGGLFGPPPRIMDCSKFAILCYQAAGLPDPCHFGYLTIGNTDAIIAHCTQVSEGDAPPGSLCFFGENLGNGKYSTVHVNVYIGNGTSINMGSPGEPAEGPSAEMGPTTTANFLGWFVPDVAPTGGSTPTPAVTPNTKTTTNPLIAGSFSSLWNG